MQPVNNPPANSSQAFELNVEEVNEKQQLKTDKEIEGMTREELVEEYKKCQFTVISEKSRNKRLEREILSAKKDHLIALAHSTTQQAVANIAENRRNRTDFEGMQHETRLCTAGRVVSLVASIAMFILTLVCILV